MYNALGFTFTLSYIPVLEIEYSKSELQQLNQTQFIATLFSLLHDGRLPLLDILKEQCANTTFKFKFMVNRLMFMNRKFSLPLLLCTFMSHILS